ncbi:hypothetical protein F511_07510 [Dorcoceras hygrometricum]|uniref:Uncharacterized protein n=1 Tax=Dorcoceras hygrometricum TaxID=472368 RepID=A0A2Z7D375_9LAMI|nr:hypothetical protein F511_07510 [Dorcoceras hygrometricum]
MNQLELELRSLLEKVQRRKQPAGALTRAAVSYSDQQEAKAISRWSVSADEERPAVAQAHMIQQMSREAQEMKRRRRRRFQSQVTVKEADLMSNVEQEADNSKRNSEESDVVLRNQQMVGVQQMKRDQLLCKQALKQRESWISDDDISSDVITISSDQQEAKAISRWSVSADEERPAVAQAHMIQQMSREAQEMKRRRRIRFQSQVTVEEADLDNQTQATTHPVESFNEPAVAMNPVASFAYPVDMESSRKKAELDNQTQATTHPVESFNEPAVAMNPVASFAYPVDMKSSRKKADVVESYHPDARFQSYGGEVTADAPPVKKAPKKPAMSKKRPAAAAAEEQVLKKKWTLKKKSVTSHPTLEMVAIAQEDNIPANQPVDEDTGETGDQETAEDVGERDDESVFVPSVAHIVDVATSTADDVDHIIQQVLSETAQSASTEGEQIEELDIRGSAVAGHSTVTIDERQLFDLPYEDLIAKWDAEKKQLRTGIVTTGLDVVDIRRVVKDTHQELIAKINSLDKQKDETRADKRPSRKNDRKVLVSEESNKNWADTDTDSSSSSYSSSDSEQEEVHCLMDNQTLEDEALSVIPRGSWGDVSRRFTMIRWAAAAAAAARRRRKFISGQLDEENPFVQNSSVLLVQADEGVSVLFVDRIGDIYRSLPKKSRRYYSKSKFLELAANRHRMRRPPPDVRTIARGAMRVGDRTSHRASTALDARLGRARRAPRSLLSRASAALVAHVGRSLAAPWRTVCTTSRKEAALSSATGRGSLADRCRCLDAPLGRRCASLARRCACAALIFFVVAPPPAGRRSGDVVTAGLISSRVWFGPVPGSP